MTNDTTSQPERVVLKLYIAGHTPRSRTARLNLERLCAERGSEFEVQVIDIVERPQLAEDEKILATPVVVRELPPPMRRIIGDLADFESVLVGLDLHETRA
ncbi:MAG: circadian clock protein KaiB [Thermoleophilia bacterium]|nr:circadian clock protein KaiB [Thermoleophilia bacterium]